MRCLNTFGATAIAVAVAAVTTTLSAQDALLYTCLNQSGNYEQTNLIKPPSLRLIDREDVVVVIPSAAARLSARKFAPHDAFTTLVGDENNDNRIWQDPLFRHTDALLWRRNSPLWAHSMRELYISTSQPVGGFVSTSGPARPADVFRVLPNGQFRFFLRDAQIRAAFSITSATLNVDAITADWDRNLIFLSFEVPQTIKVHNMSPPITLTAQDGAILALKVTAWAEPVVLPPNAGLMVATEAQVAAMVNASNIRDRDNVDIGASIIDVDGLHLSTRTGTFQNNWGIWPNLAFCGQRLTGGGIVNTLGQVEWINGMPMGSTVSATTGQQVGLFPVPAPNVESLNGLHRHPAAAVAPFVLETPTPFIVGPGLAQVDIEGIIGAPAVAALFFDAYAMPIHPFNPLFVSIVNTWFPETILTVPWPYPFLFVPLNAQAVGSWSVALPPPGFDAKIVFQAAVWTPGGFALSTPCTLESKK